MRIRRYVVGHPERSPFRFLTARRASRFLSGLRESGVVPEGVVLNRGRAARVWRWDRREGEYREIW